MKKDIIMTLDAGGTNLVFSAMNRDGEMVRPITLPSAKDNLEDCQQTIISGFEKVKETLNHAPSAISFGFPGPADYEAGIIGGNLPNLTAFRNGVPLGPILEQHFGIPVFINNDGNLFAYGEALAGILPEINAELEASGNPKRYHNLLGVTLGTGFGGGIVIHGNLLRGDNQTGGYLWCQPNKIYPDRIAEESVSIRGICRTYACLSGDNTRQTPKDIFDIAENIRPGNRKAAVTAFEELGEVAGYVISSAVTLIDGLVVIGGGLSGASKYILPALMREMRAELSMADGSRFPRLPVEAYNLEDSSERKSFLQKPRAFTGKTGIAVSRLGTSRAVALGAYWYAINNLK